MTSYLFFTELQQRNRGRSKIPQCQMCRTKREFRCCTIVKGFTCRLFKEVKPQFSLVQGTAILKRMVNDVDLWLTNVQECLWFLIKLTLLVRRTLRLGGLQAFFEDRQLLSLTAFAHCCCSSLPPEIDPTPTPSRLSHQLLCT
ncbi:hypothetical protein CEXT_493441 [Caerostris extrusa]|uniref:Uncharacterized protein n=1 Tax=Caerostris extrusa TaxID=172846 RepID=A0AAV4XWG2_CAEEX|nr:hypothetical protein CEXT_493441 [Caerostris extrusa]